MLRWLSRLPAADTAVFCADPDRFGAYRYYCEFFTMMNSFACLRVRLFFIVDSVDSTASSR